MPASGLNVADRSKFLLSPMPGPLFSLAVEPG
jgi:hypothetical protein